MEIQSIDFHIVLESFSITCFKYSILPFEILEIGLQQNFFNQNGQNNFEKIISKCFSWFTE